MINLNLLSPQHKQQIKNRKIYIALKEWVMLVLLFTAIVSILLIVSKYFLEEKLNDLIIQNSNSIGAMQKINMQTSALNKKISDLDKIQNDFKRWSIFINSVQGAAPAGIKFSTIKIQQKEKAIELQGTSKTRQDMLLLQENLNQTGLFSKIEIPLSALLLKENSDFNIQATIISEKIK